MEKEYGDSKIRRGEQEERQPEKRSRKRIKSEKEKKEEEEEIARNSWLGEDIVCSSG